jgi:MFS family permease
MLMHPQVPIYVTAAVVAVIGAFFSDRRGTRSPFIIGFMCMIGIGFIICIAAAGRGLPGLVYAGVFIAVVGKQPPLTYLLK